MYKLVIADDERIIRESVRDLIPWKELDIEVCACCQNGLEALDAVQDTGADIVMTDIRMPGISGLELIEKIRGIDEHIQFIILTGYSEFEYARQAMRYGVGEYLLKPISEEEIIPAVIHAKEAISSHGMSKILQLLSSLMEMREKNEVKQAEYCLKHYLSHFQTEEDLQNVGLELLIRLHIYFENLSPESLTAFEKEIRQISGKDKLKQEIQKRIVYLLFEQKGEKVSLAERVGEYVQQHLNDENLSLKFIAENVLYVNVNYLSRAFTKQTGEKFSVFLNRTRIEKSKRILKKGIMNIHQIAEVVGFGSNPQYFSQVFKKYTGITPTEYAEKQNYKIL